MSADQERAGLQRYDCGGPVVPATRGPFVRHEDHLQAIAGLTQERDAAVARAEKAECKLVIAQKDAETYCDRMNDVYDERDDAIRLMTDLVSFGRPCEGSQKYKEAWDRIAAYLAERGGGP